MSTGAAAVEAPADGPATAGRVAVRVSTPGGRDLGEFTFPPGATVLDLKAAIARAGGPAVAKQRLISPGAELLDDPRAALASVGDGEPAMQMTLVESRRRNLALASQGAQLAGELGRAWDASRPLLRYDAAFPEWPEDLASDQVAGVPGQCHGVRELPQALPVSFGSAAEFQEHLKSVDAAWQGDCQQSTFLPNPAEVVIRLPGDGSFVEKVGFTYSPWDRNYGRACEAFLSADGESWARAGEVQIPWGSERGDPSRQSTATLFVDVPAAMQEEPCKFVKLDFSGSRGSGRRLFFVYAFGF